VTECSALSLLSKDTFGQLLATGGDMVAATCLFSNAVDPEEKKCAQQMVPFVGV